MPDIRRDVRSPLPISDIESEFSALVSSLKALDTTRKRATALTNGQQLLTEACDDYCAQTKRSLRTVIQLVDNLVEQSREGGKRMPLQPRANQNGNRGNMYQISTKGEGKSDKALISGDMMFKLRHKVVVQKTLDHWKMYCVSKRIKKAMDAKQAELISRLESAQKLAEGAKSEMFKENQAKGELTKLRAEGVRHTERVQILESHLEDLKKDNENLKSSNVRLMASSRAAIGHKSEDENTHSNKVKAVQEDLRLLTQQLTQSNNTINELTEEISTLKSHQDEEKRELQEAVRKLESKLAPNRDAVTPPRKVIDPELNSLRSKLETTEFEARQLRADLDQSEKECDRLRTEVQVTLSSMEKTRAIEKSLNDDLQVAKIERQDFERKLAELRNELSLGIGKVEGARLKSEISRLTDRTVALEKELETVRVMKKTSEDETGRLQSDLETAEAQIEQLLAERSALKGVESIRADLTSRFEAEKKLTSDLKSELAAKDMEMAEQERKISSLSRRIDMLSTKTPELTEEGEDVKDLQKELYQLGVENCQLKSQLETYQQPDVEQQQLRSYIIELENDIHVREEREKNMQAQMELLDSDLNSAETEIENLNKLLDEKSHEQVKSESAQVRQLRTELEAIMTDRAQVKAELSKQLDSVEKVRGDLEDVQAALVVAESNVRSKSEAVIAAEEAKTKVELELRKVVNGDLKQKDSRMENLEIEIRAKSTTIKDLESKVSELSSMKINYASIKSELDRVKMEKKSLEAHLKANAGDKAASELNKMLKSQIEELSGQLQTSELKLASAQSEIRDLNSVIKLADDRSRTRKHRLSVIPCSSPVEVVGVKLSDEKNEILKSQLKDSESRVIELMKERVKLGEQLRVLQAESLKPSSDMEFAIEQLVQEKSTLMDRMSKIEDMLGIKQKGRLDILEQVVRDLLAQARPSLTLRALSAMVGVDAAGTVASYAGANKDTDMCGCLITDNPLPLFDEGVYFEVRVMRANTNNPDGLTVGVSLTPPWDFRDENLADGLTPNTLDDIPHSWAVGYNGQCWSSSRREWRETSWCAKDLTPGQRVGVLLTCPPVSQLFIFVDDALVCRGPARLPSCIDNDYYGLVDLLGNCDSVTLLWGARPPAIAAGLAPLDPGRLNFRLPSRKSVSPSSALEVSSELVPFSPTGVGVPRLPLRPTIQPRYPPKPPSDFSSEAE